MKPRKPYYRTTKCRSCKSGTTLTAEGNPVPCPYCKGTQKVSRLAVHPSHHMSRRKVEILAPAGTERFYSVRYCTKCGREEWEAAAGHFLHELEFPCKGELK